MLKQKYTFQFVRYIFLINNINFVTIDKSRHLKEHRIKNEYVYVVAFSLWHHYQQCGYTLTNNNILFYKLRCKKQVTMFHKIIEYHS